MCYSWITGQCLRMTNHIQGMKGCAALGSMVTARIKSSWPTGGWLSGGCSPFWVPLHGGPFPSFREGLLFVLDSYLQTSFCHARPAQNSTATESRCPKGHPGSPCSVLVPRKGRRASVLHSSWEQGWLPLLSSQAASGHSTSLALSVFVKRRHGSCSPNLTGIRVRTK